MGLTPIAVGDTLAYTDNGYMGLMGGSTTQRIDVNEVYLGGLATASAPCAMVLARDSTVQATPVALTGNFANGPEDPATAALVAPQVAFTASTTKPQRAATLAKLAMAFNAFGGVVRLNLPVGQEFKLVGNAANLGEVSLSSFTGGTPGLMMVHMIYEPY